MACSSGLCFAPEVSSESEGVKNEKLGTTPDRVNLINKWLEHCGPLDDIKKSYSDFLSKDVIERLATSYLYHTGRNETRGKRIFFKANIVTRSKTRPGTTKETVPIFPQEARTDRKDYVVSVVGHPMYQTEKNGKWSVPKPVNKNIQDKELFQLPCMLKSDYCNLVVENLDEEGLSAVGEDPADMGGYFIIGGLEKWIFLVDRLRFHINLVLPPKESKTIDEALEASLITNVKHGSAKGRRVSKPKMTVKEKIFCKQTILLDSGTVQMKISLGLTNDLRFETLELDETVPGSKIGNSVNILHLMHLMVLYFSNEILEAPRDRNPLSYKLVEAYSNGLANGNVFTEMKDLVVKTASFMLKNLIDPKYAHNVVVNFTDTKVIYESVDVNLVISDIIGWRKVNIDDGLGRDAKKKIRRDVIRTFIERFIFPNIPIGRMDEKLWSLMIMCMRLIRVDIGLDTLSTRDGWINKRLFSPADNLSSIFKNVWSGVHKGLQETLNDGGDISGFPNTAQTRMGEITNTIHKYMVNKPPKTGHKNSSKDKLTTENLGRNNPISTLGQLTKIASAINKNSKSLAVRSVQGDARGRVCPVTTTDDKNCGFVKAKAITAQITPKIDIMLQLEMYKERNIIKDWKKASVTAKRRPEGMEFPVLYNGRFIGWCASDARSIFVQDRIMGHVDKNVSFVKSKSGFLEIYSDAGRMVRPVLLVENNKIKLFSERPDWKEMSMDDIIAGGYIDMLDAYEENSEDIIVAADDIDLENYPIRLRQLEQSIANTTDEEAKAIYMKNLENMKKYPYTHTDLHPLVLLSVASATAPYAGHNMSCRVSYYSKMIKQSLSIDIMPSSHKSGFFSAAAMQPVVEPRINKALGLHSQPVGNSCYIAFAALPMNQEDNVVVTKRFIDSGVFRYYNHHVFKTKIETSTKTHQQRLGRPTTVRMINGRDPTHALTRDGLPAIGSWLDEGDIVIGVLQTKTTHGGVTEAEDSSQSIRVGFKSRGYVHDISVKARPDVTEVSILLLEPRQPQIGDKLTSRYAQKATIGQITNIADEYYFVTQTGMVKLRGENRYEPKYKEVYPDMIVNPHSIAGRMTIGFVLEMLSGGAALPTGEVVDATAMENYNPEKFIRSLTRYGFCRVNSGVGRKASNVVKLIDGKTGIAVDADVYVGPAHYFQLPHIAEIKSYGRGWNLGMNVDPFTKQPKKGRSKGGGLRFGNMEIYAFMANMAPATARDILMTLSDQTEVVICRACSVMAGYDGAKKKYFCPECESEESLALLEIPYSFRLIYELMNSVGIRFDAKTETYDELLVRLKERAVRYAQRHTKFAKK